MTNPVASDIPNEATADTFPAVRGWMRTIASRLRGLVARENTLLVTLTANVASTTVTDARIASTTAFLPSATTANAAAALATTYVSETGRINGTWVITHANNAQVDRIYRVKLGGV